MNTMLLELLEPKVCAHSHIRAEIDSKEIIRSIEAFEIKSGEHDFIPCNAKKLIGVTIDQALDFLNVAHDLDYKGELKPRWVISF